jgi:hypothetical protein
MFSRKMFFSPLLPGSIRNYPIHDYRLTFPIGVDEASGDASIPVTMRRFQMRGTPTLILIDRAVETLLMVLDRRTTWRSTRL